MKKQRGKGVERAVKTAVDNGRLKRGGPRSRVVAGVMSGDGSYTGLNKLRANGFDVFELEGDGYKIVAKSQDPDAAELAVSAEIRDDQDDRMRKEEGLITPPWPFKVLNALMASNTVHAAAIETKASDYSSDGYVIEPVKGVEDLGIAESELDAELREVERFLACGVDGKPIEELIQPLAVEWEVLGSAGYEWRRNAKGLLASVNHVPFADVLMINEAKYKEHGARFLQQRFRKKRFFLPVPEKVEYTQQGFDPVSSPIEDFPAFADRADAVTFRERQVHVERPTREHLGPEDWKTSANELYFMARPPHTLSSLYGTPAAATAIKSILAQEKIDQYNLQFFDAKGVPQYVVVIEGLTEPETMDLPQDSEGDDETEHYDPMVGVEDELRQFFLEQLTAQDRSLAIVSTFGEAKVRFEKLTGEGIEAAFADYEKRNTEMVRLAHRVPPAAMGIIDTANLGSGREVGQMRRYRSHIVDKGQRAFENAINFTLRVGLLCPHFQVKFNRMEIEELNTRRKETLDAFKSGLMTIDEARVRYEDGLEEWGEEGGGNIAYLHSGNVTPLHLTDDQMERFVLDTVNTEKAFRRLIGEAIVEGIPIEDEL